jgi:hypothetical protein
VSYTAIHSEQLSSSDDARRQNALSLVFFLLAAAAFLLRFDVSPQLLDRLMDYTSDGGAFYEKLHLGTDAIILLTPFVLFSRPFFLKDDEIVKFRWLLRFTLLLFALIAYLAVMGRVNSSGVLIDSYVVAAAAGMLMFALNEGFRRGLGNVTLVMLIISAGIGIVEAITKHRLLPYDRIELQFRPIALSDHPLGLGGWCATAIGFVPLTRWRVWVKVGAVVLLLVGCAASGARVALLISAAEVLILLLFLPWPGLSPRHARQAKAIVLIFTLLGGAALTTLLFAGGLLSRFANTLFDENFLARVNIYQVFGLVKWSDIMFGMRADTLLEIVNTQLHLPAIESAPVVITLLLGLPLAIFFTVLVAWTIYRLVKGAPLAAWVGTAAFLLTALSNNTLSSKTPVVVIIVVLLVAYAIPKSRHANDADA